MADSTAHTIHDALVGKIAAIDGSAPYTFTFAGSGAVRAGRAAKPWTTGTPCAEVWLERTEEVTEGVAIGWYREDCFWGVRLSVPITDVEGQTRSPQIADAVADVKRVVRLDTSLGVAAVIDTSFEHEQYEGDHVEHPGMPQATLTLRTRHYTTGRS